jgi:hypothetical protein
MTLIKDSGTRSHFDTGAVRDGQEGKGRMDLLPVRALIEVAKVFEAGARKYNARNWEKGIPLSRYMDSGLRHSLKWLRGDRDEPHLAMAIWNFMCLQDTQQRIAEGWLPMELNDLPCNPIELTPKARSLVAALESQARKVRHAQTAAKKTIRKPRKTRKSRG